MINKIQNKKLLTLLFIILFTLPTFILTNSNNLRIEDRDKFLQEEIPFKSYTPNLTPQKFCMLIRGENDQIPCNSNKSNLHEKITNEIRMDVFSEIESAIQSIKSLKKEILNTKYSNYYINQLSELLGRRIELLEEAKKNSIENREKSNENKFLLRSLLIAQGYTYNEYSDQFKRVSYDISRYIIKPDEIKKQLSTLQILASNLPVISLIWLFLYIFLVQRKINTAGQFYFGILSLIITFGLVIVRDASLHFGTDSSLYNLNPFRNYLERQLLQTIIPGMILFSTIILSIKKISIFCDKLLNWFSIKYMALCFIPISSAAYLLQGQALGAELIKICTCCICAAILTKHGRIFELAQEHFGIMPILRRFIKFKNLINNSHIKSNQSIDTAGFFGIYALHEIFLPILLLVILIGSAALAFSDLGGSTIALIILVFSIYILLGKKFATIFFIFFIFTATLLIKFSDKVFARVQLMLEPMRANVSDFARLIEFEKSSQPFGYGLNNIQWCSNSGVCIPLQSLSDYIPTIISALMGEFLTISLFIIYIIFLLILIYRCFIPSWYFNNNDRFVSMLASLLCLATLSQLIITFFGNWRMIPLTGLGTPLISIGYSSMVAGIIGIGLALALTFSKNE